MWNHFHERPSDVIDGGVMDVWEEFGVRLSLTKPQSFGVIWLCNSAMCVFYRDGEKTHTAETRRWKGDGEKREQSGRRNVISGVVFSKNSLVVAASGAGNRSCAALWEHIFSDCSLYFRKHNPYPHRFSHIEVWYKFPPRGFSQISA